MLAKYPIHRMENPMSDKTPSKASDFDPEVMKLFDQYVHGVIDQSSHHR